MQTAGSTLRIGVDLGGTKTELVALDRDGVELYRKRAPTPGYDYAAIVDGIRALVLDAEAQLGAHASVGVGTPGALSPATGLLRNSNTTCLNGRALDLDLSRALGREVRIANDANCFALSEAVDGAGKSAAVVFGVIIGTGVGGGVVGNRQLLVGKNAIAGEWGHNPLPWASDAERPGPECYCGKRGCIETFASGPGLARDYQRAGGQKVVNANSIAAQAEQGEPLARAVLDRYIDRLARSLATVLNLLDPDVVVLGGGLSQIDALYRELPARLASYVLCDRIATLIVRAQHGDSSGVRGAAWLWPPHFESGSASK
jgi:fructokinase